MLAHSQALKVIYEKRLALQQIWAKTSANGHDMLAAIKDWVHEAEASGIQSLKEFAAQLKTYSLRPPDAWRALAGASAASATRRLLPARCVRRRQCDAPPILLFLRKSTCPIRDSARRRPPIFGVPRRHAGRHAEQQEKERAMLLDYLIMLVYALAMLGLGWYGMRKAKSQSDFLVAGRRLGPGLYLGTMAAVVLGGASTIGTVKLGYQFGLSGLWLVFMLGLGIIVLSLVFSRQIARLRVFTVTQVLEQRYQASSRLIGGVVMVAYDLMVAVTATIAIGSVTEVVFGIPRIPAILCGGGIVIVYSVIGGMWSLR